MGRLTVNEVATLKESGVLNEDTIAEMQEAGLVSTRTRNTSRWMRTKNNTWVSPQLYFQGLDGSEYSKKMTEFRAEFQSLVTKYCTSKTKEK